MSHSVVLAGGGTAGHVNPLLSVAQEIRRRYPDAEITVLGTEEGLEATLVPQAGFDLQFIPRVPMPRRPTPEWFSLPGKLSRAIKAAKSAISEIDADVVIGFGGYVSTPAYLAAKDLKVPVVIQEQNVRAGIANKLGSRWAHATTTSFEATQLKDAVVTGLPLRPEIAELIEKRKDNSSAARQAAAHELGLDSSRPVVLITGGSLGALKVNRTMSASAQEILETGVQILHLTGKGKAEEVVSAVQALPKLLQSDYHVLEYLPAMHLAYAVADMVVCRSGAGTVCELAALGLPAVFVPLPIGNGEQRLNAAGLVEAGAALIVDDASFDASWVNSHVVPLLSQPCELARMAKAAATVGKPQATNAVVDVVARSAGWEK